MSIAPVCVRLSEAAQVAEMLERAAVGGAVEDVTELAAGLGVIARDIRASMALLDDLEAAQRKQPRAVRS